MDLSQTKQLIDYLEMCLYYLHEQKDAKREMDKMIGERDESRKSLKNWEKSLSPFTILIQLFGFVCAMGIAFVVLLILTLIFSAGDWLVYSGCTVVGLILLYNIIRSPFDAVKWTKYYKDNIQYETDTIGRLNDTYLEKSENVEGIKQDDIVPDEYFSIKPIFMFLKYLKHQRAFTLGECINLFEQEQQMERIRDALDDLGYEIDESVKAMGENVAKRIETMDKNMVKQLRKATNEIAGEVSKVKSEMEYTNHKLYKG
jgi:ABC-type multidrug transport system fused ATPase/permease subunit